MEKKRKKGGEGRVLEEGKKRAKNLREKFEREKKKQRRRKRRREGEIKEERKKV